MTSLTNVAVHYVADDDAVRESVSALLESYGAIVTGFERASDILESPPDGEQGCLVLDVHLPDLSGFELLARLRDMGRVLADDRAPARPRPGARHRAAGRERAAGPGRARPAAHHRR